MLLCRAPSKVANVPLGHRAHGVVEPRPEEKVPAAQIWHVAALLAAVVLENVPPPQLRHALMVVACGVTLYLPPAHAMQPARARVSGWSV